MPGASGCPLSPSASAGGCISARPSTRSISARGRPPGRSSIGSSKQPTMVDLDADRDRRRHRRSGRSAPRGRSAHARPWSGRRDPRGWPMAPPRGRRRRAGCRAPPGGPVSGSRPCRGRRWRDRPPRKSCVFGSTSVSGPGQNASASARSQRRQSARSCARRRYRRHGRSAD